MALMSLYDDLPHFEYDMTIDNLKNLNNKLKKSIEELKKRIKQLENEKSQFKTINIILSKNITSLYKTASSEIQRKDKTISELRKSQNNTLPISKMFSSNNNLFKNTPSHKTFKDKQDVEYSCIVKNSTTVLNENNSDNIPTITIQPNHDIPKTVYYKRLCQKLIQKKQTIDLESKIPDRKENNVIAKTDKLKQNKNEELNSTKNIFENLEFSHVHNNSKEIINSTEIICSENEVHKHKENDLVKTDELKLHVNEPNNLENIFKKTHNPSFHNDSKEDLNSTLMICESDVSPNNNLSESFFSKLTKPVKLKKKMIFTPATIGVQNVSNKSLECFENLKTSRNLYLKTQEKIQNFPENKINSIKETPLVFNKEQCTKFDSKLDEKQLPITNIIQNQNSSISEINQIPSINIDVEQVPVRRKTIVIKKNNNTQDLIKEKKLIHDNCTSPTDNNVSTMNVKSLSTTNEKQIADYSSKINKQNYNQYKSKLSNTNDVNNSLESLQLKNTLIENNSVNKISLPSINIEVEQVPIRRKRVIIKKDINASELNESKNYSFVTCKSPLINNELNMPNKNIKCLSINDNEKELSCSLKNKNLQSKCKLTIMNHNDNFEKFEQSKDSSKNITVDKNLIDKTDEPSINIEVEQGLIFRHSNARKVIMHLNQEENKQETKKGRRVQLITIKDHCSQPLPSFNGAKKTEIDVSKKSIHIEKVVESSSLFYVPQVKRRRTMNFGNADS